jgi:hypothetical protein
MHFLCVFESHHLNETLYRDEVSMHLTQWSEGNRWHLVPSAMGGDRRTHESLSDEIPASFASESLCGNPRSSLRNVSVLLEHTWPRFGRRGNGRSARSIVTTERGVECLLYAVGSFGWAQKGWSLHSCHDPELYVVWPALYDNVEPGGPQHLHEPMPQTPCENPKARVHPWIVSNRSIYNAEDREWFQKSHRQNRVKFSCHSDVAGRHCSRVPSQKGRWYVREREVHHE